ncbi:MAG: Asd/ArgC dimerization domain-containing protein, partial [Candidatus Acidiferrales bacterium]
VPYIPREEERVAIETRKILGRLGEGGISEHPLKVSATCTRASVLAGHTEAVTAALKKPTPIEDVIAAFERFGTNFTGLALPSSPQHMITVHRNPMRPQPRLDRDAGGGMSVTVGRLFPDSVFDYRFVVLGHNTIRGAAGAAILNAELLQARGLLATKPARKVAAPVKARGR